jgi:hypothetical protein
MAVNAAPSGKAPPAFGEVAVGLGTLLGSVMPTPRALARMTSGLGLSLVKAIIERHNGHVTVGDALGGGALFEIRLPLQLKAHAAPTT